MKFKEFVNQKWFKSLLAVVLLFILVGGSYGLGNIHGMVGAGVRIVGYESVCNEFGGNFTDGFCYIQSEFKNESDVSCFEIKDSKFRIYALDEDVFQQKFLAFVVMGQRLNYCPVDDTIIIKTNGVCFYNGYEIDCNNNCLDLPIIPTSGNFDKKPIFKYQNKWIDKSNCS